MSNPKVHFHQAKYMRQEAKDCVQATLTRLAIEKGIRSLVLDRGKGGYVARIGGTYGLPHPLIEIVTKHHNPVTVFWDGEPWE